MLFKQKRDALECSWQSKYPKALLQNSLKQTILALQYTGNFFKQRQKKHAKGKLQHFVGTHGSLNTLTVRPSGGGRKLLCLNSFVPT